MDISGCQYVDDTAFDFFRKVHFVGLWMANGVSKGKRVDLARRGIVVIDNIYDK